MNLLDFIRGMKTIIPRNDREKDSAQLTVVLNRENPPKAIIQKTLEGAVTIEVVTAKGEDET